MPNEVLAYKALPTLALPLMICTRSHNHKRRNSVPVGLPGVDDLGVDDVVPLGGGVEEVVQVLDGGRQGVVDAQDLQEHVVDVLLDGTLQQTNRTCGESTSSATVRQ